MNYLYTYLIVSVLITGYLQYSQDFLGQLKELPEIQESILTIGENPTWIILGIVMLLTMPLILLKVIWNIK